MSKIAAAAIVWLAYTTFALAQSVAPTPAPPFDLTPVLLPILIAVATAVVGWIGILGQGLAKVLKVRFGLDIENVERDLEAKHRDAIHTAILNALGQALARFPQLTSIDVSNGAGQLIVGLVRASVPEAVAALDVTNKWIADTAASKLALIVAAQPPTPTVVVAAPAAPAQ